MGLLSIRTFNRQDAKRHIRIACKRLSWRVQGQTKDKSESKGCSWDCIPSCWHSFRRKGLYRGRVWREDRGVGGAAPPTPTWTRYIGGPWVSKVIPKGLSLRSMILLDKGNFKIWWFICCTHIKVGFITFGGRWMITCGQDVIKRWCQSWNLPRPLYSCIRCLLSVLLQSLYLHSLHCHCLLPWFFSMISLLEGTNSIVFTSTWNTHGRYLIIILVRLTYADILTHC